MTSDSNRIILEINTINIFRHSQIFKASHFRSKKKSQGKLEDI